MPPPAGSCDRMLCVHAHARTTRRAQLLEAHAVVIGALLSALARLIHRRCRQMRLTAGSACIRLVSPRAHTILHTTAHTGTCSGAHTCTRLPMSTCATSHTHTRTSHLCAHAHTHMHTARQTASHTETGYPRAHTCNTRTHTHLPTYTHTHEDTQTHKRTCARSHIYTNVCVHM